MCFGASVHSKSHFPFTFEKFNSNMHKNSAIAFRVSDSRHLHHTLRDAYGQ